MRWHTEEIEAATLIAVGRSGRLGATTGACRFCGDEGVTSDYEHSHENQRCDSCGTSVYRTGYGFRVSSAEFLPDGWTLEVMNDGETVRFVDDEAEASEAEAAYERRMAGDRW